MSACHLFYGLAHHGHLTSDSQGSSPLRLKSLLNHRELSCTDVLPQFGTGMAVRLTSRQDVGLAVMLDEKGQGQRVSPKRRDTQIGRPSVEEPADRTIEEIRRDNRYEILRPTGTHD